MINFDLWLHDSAAINETPRAVQAWNRILDKPVSVTFRKPDGTTLAAQTVRIESDNQNRILETQSAGGQLLERPVTIFGVVNHPNSDVADTDMAEGYRFVYLNDEYRVRDVITTLGELQGIAEAIG